MLELMFLEQVEALKTLPATRPGLALERPLAVVDAFVSSQDVSGSKALVAVRVVARKGLLMCLMSSAYMYSLVNLQSAHATIAFIAAREVAGEGLLAGVGDVVGLEVFLGFEPLVAELTRIWSLTSLL